MKISVSSSPLLMMRLRRKRSTKLWNRQVDFIQNHCKSVFRPISFLFEFLEILRRKGISLESLAQRTDKIMLSFNMIIMLYYWMDAPADASKWGITGRIIHSKPASKSVAPKPSSGTSQMGTHYKHI